MARLFFAVWPDDAAAKQLGKLAREVAERLGGKPTPQEKIHLTLAFLGDVDPERIADAETVSVRQAAFGLRLDRLGSFRDARVAWAGCAATPPELTALHERLSDELRALGFGLEERRFAPHATIARRIDRGVQAEPIAPIGWTVHGFALVRSELGTGRYSTLREWTLGE